MIPQIAVPAMSAKLIAVILAVLVIAGGGFAGGCRWNKGEKLEAEAAQAQAERERDNWREAAGLWETAIKAQNRENAAAREAAAKQQKKLDAAVDRANQAADKFARRLVDLNRTNAADFANPDCAEQMRRPVCGSPLR